MADIPAARIEHLGMIQNVIERMASESARMKQFALVALGTLAATAEATSSPTLAYVSGALIVVFWYLDAKYLAQERTYRRLYDEVRGSDAPTDFRMTVDGGSRTKDSAASAAFGWSVAPIYGALLLLSLLMAQLVG